MYLFYKEIISSLNISQIFNESISPIDIIAMIAAIILYFFHDKFKSEE